MLLGKRPRPPMKRTTSMTGITVDFHDHSQQQQQPGGGGGEPTEQAVGPGVADNYDHLHQQYFMSMISPRPNNNNPRRSSADFIETAHFLRTCGLCNRRLVSGRDIYMYKGDTAFCSLECREKQMKIDEKTNKKKINDTSSSSKTVAAT